MHVTNTRRGAHAYMRISKVKSVSIILGCRLDVREITGSRYEVRHSVELVVDQRAPAEGARTGGVRLPLHLKGQQTEMSRIWLLSIRSGMS